MKLSILGSSSAGNCYVLHNDTTALVIECGVPLAEVKKAVGYNISKIAGAIVTHEHLDHAKYIPQFLDSRIAVYASIGTAVCASQKVGIAFNPWNVKTLLAHTAELIGEFTVMPFDVQHDAAEPLGFLIQHPECGTVLFATDTYYLQYTFAGLNQVIIEANYRIDLLQANIDRGRVPAGMRDRTLQSHMSLATCKEALLANDLTKVNNIVLIHLSDGNSNAEEFQKEIQAATGKTVYVADKGLNIDFNVTPF